MQAVSTETPRSARSGYDLSFTSPRSGSNKSTSSETNSTPGRKSMFLVSLIDNRAREVGFAAMNLRSSDIFLTQFVENSTSYSNTCNMLNVYDPVEIIIPNTLAASKIALTISQTFQNAKTTYVARKLYNETKGDYVNSSL
jgi:DNA mismatch repair protein MSH4